MTDPADTRSPNDSPNSNPPVMASDNKANSTQPQAIDRSAAIGPESEKTPAAHKPRFVPRHRARGKVECRRGAAGSSNNIGLALIDVSEQGACVTVKEAINEGRTVELRMYGKGENRPIVALAKVIRCEAMEEGGFELGVRFDRRISYTDVRRLT